MAAFGHVLVDADGALRVHSALPSGSEGVTFRAGEGADVGGDLLDAAVDARQLRRVAQRGVLAMGRVGAAFTHGSGDYGIAFSTDRHSAPPPDRQLDPYFRATLDASADAIVSSLWHAPTTIGRAGHTAHGLQDVLRARGLLS